MTKKRKLLAAASGLVAVAIVGTSLAYFSAETNARNMISAGNLGVDLILDKEESSKYATNNEWSIANASSGDEFAYPLQAQNSGDFDSYVRITLTKYWENQDGIKEFAADAHQAVLKNIDQKDWIVDASDENGEVVYAYYKYPLASGETTTTLMDAVLIEDINNFYTDLRLKVDVEVDAIQKAAAQDAILAEWGLEAVFDENGALRSVEE